MLEVKNLEKAFGKKKVLKDINFKIDKGDVIGIIGPSGCGKSTLLRCINLLEIPTSGTIIFEGNNINYHHNLESIRKKIGMVFQSFNLFNNMTVIENIILAPTKLGILTKEEAIKKANKLLKKINLLDKKDFYPEELSGGQKQRIAIARALLMKTEIILFDEATSALDNETQSKIQEAIDNLKGKYTILIVAHRLSTVIDSDKIFVVDDGKIIASGTHSELLESCSLYKKLYSKDLV